MNFKKKCYIQIVTNIIYFNFYEKIFRFGQNWALRIFFYMIFLLFFGENGQLLSMEKWWNFTNSQYFVLWCLFLDSLYHCDPEKPPDLCSNPILKKGLISGFCHYKVYGTLNLVLRWNRNRNSVRKMITFSEREGKI